MTFILHDSTGHCLHVGRVWEITHRGALEKFTAHGFWYSFCFYAQVHIKIKGPYQ